MTDRMNLARFQALVSAYGASAQRWPGEERDAAAAFARTDPYAAALLAEADTVDGLLFAHRVGQPSRTLRTMILESAPARRRPMRIRLWWTGFAFALAGAAGIFAGSAATAALEAAPHVLASEHAQDDLPAYDDPSEENAR